MHHGEPFLLEERRADVHYTLFTQRNRPATHLTLHSRRRLETVCSHFIRTNVTIGSLSNVRHDRTFETQQTSL